MEGGRDGGRGRRGCVEEAGERREVEECGGEGSSLADVSESSAV